MKGKFFEEKKDKKDNKASNLIQQIWVVEHEAKRLNSHHHLNGDHITEIELTADTLFSNNRKLSP